MGCILLMESLILKPARKPLNPLISKSGILRILTLNNEQVFLGFFLSLISIIELAYIKVQFYEDFYHNFFNVHFILPIKKWRNVPIFTLLDSPAG